MEGRRESSEKTPVVEKRIFKVLLGRVSFLESGAT